MGKDRFFKLLGTSVLGGSIAFANIPDTNSRPGLELKYHTYLPDIVRCSEDFSYKLVAQRLSISSLGIDNEPIEEAKVVDNVWFTPDEGLVSSGRVIWSHVSFKGEPRIFGRLKNINRGDSVLIGGTLFKSTDGVAKKFLNDPGFMVSDIILADEHFVAATISRDPDMNTDSYLVTSLRERNSSRWLIDPDWFQTKNPKIEGDIFRLSNQAHLVIRLSMVNLPNICTP